MDKDKIHESISQIKLEDEAYHKRIIEYLTHEDDDYSLSWKGDAVGFASSPSFTWGIASRILSLSIPTFFSVRSFACISQYLSRDGDI